MIMNVTFRQVKVFEVVARHLSFTQAAQQLHLTQPAVSMQIKQLEEATGLHLFEQLGKKVFLTEAGKEMIDYCRNIASQLSEAEEVLEQLKGVRRGHLFCATGIWSIGMASACRRWRRPSDNMFFATLIVFRSNPEWGELKRIC